jgi:NADH:ubiquinone oxidoreductase subunit E
VVTFYSFFSTEPRGEHTIRYMLGTACYVRAAAKLSRHCRRRWTWTSAGRPRTGKFTFEIARCIGACGLAPAMMIDNVVYKQVNPNKLDSILSQY